MYNFRGIIYISGSYLVYGLDMRSLKGLLVFSQLQVGHDHANLTSVSRLFRMISTLTLFGISQHEAKDTRLRSIARTRSIRIRSGKVAGLFGVVRTK